MRIRMIYPNDPTVNIYQLRLFWYPLITFPVLAAYTPEEHDVEIIDEVFEAVDFDAPADLAVLTGMTYMAPRAYEIADAFRARGVKTVMGGIHASALPEEALDHVDAVVIGEGEMVWPQILKDAACGALKKIYRGHGPFDMKQYRRPRYELLQKYFTPGKQYHPYGYNSLNVMEISRGCPFNCDFCSVTNYWGAEYRSRPIRDVIQDMRHLKLLFRDRFFNLNDDNLLGNRAYFLELMENIRKLNIRWAGQISVNAAKDAEILKRMSESGCDTVFIGLESLSSDSLLSVNKTVNKTDEYRFIMEQFTGYNLRVVASIIFGLDGDDPSVFEKTVEFINEYPVLTPSYTLLTPFPGSRLYDRLTAQGRISDFNWRHYDLGHVVIHPLKMSQEQLKTGFLWAMEQFETYKMNAQQVGNERMKLTPDTRG